MTYNKPVLLSVDTAFNVVLGAGVVDLPDHITSEDCRPTDSNHTSENGGCGL